MGTHPPGSPTILVTGAGGKTGRTLLSWLSRQGVEVRILLRSARHAERLPSLDRTQVITGDMLDPSVIDQAVEGVGTVYHIPPNMHPQEVKMAAGLLSAAHDAGVSRFVYHSVMHPQLPAMPHHWRKLQVETLVIESGLQFTILQPAAYMQNLLTGWTSIERNGVYRVPYSPSTRLQLVDLNDVAEAAARVLLQPGHADAIYELAGPSAPTQRQVADLLSTALERPVRVEQVSLEEWSRQAQGSGMPPARAEEFVAMFRHYDQHGFLGNPTALTGLLGHEPTGLAAFLERIVAEQDASDGVNLEDAGRVDHG